MNREALEPGIINRLRAEADQFFRANRRPLAVFSRHLSEAEFMEVVTAVADKPPCATPALYGVTSQPLPIMDGFSLQIVDSVEAAWPAADALPAFVHGRQFSVMAILWESGKRTMHFVYGEKEAA